MTSAAPSSSSSATAWWAFASSRRRWPHGLADRYEIVVFGEEPHPAYHRVHLSSLFDDTAEDLTLADAPWYAATGIASASE